MLVNVTLAVKPWARMRVNWNTQEVITWGDGSNICFGVWLATMHLTTPGKRTDAAGTVRMKIVAPKLVDIPRTIVGKNCAKQHEKLMKLTTYKGINYAGHTDANRNNKTGIRFGVIPANEVGQSWYDSSEADYGDPTCPKCGNKPNKARKADYHCPGCKYHFDSDEAYGETPQAFTLNDGEYKAEQSGEDCDIFILDSPYFTYAQFCSPCAPGACYLLNPLESPEPDNKAYCFGHDWFDDGKAPYPVYSVATGMPVNF